MNEKLLFFCTNWVQNVNWWVLNDNHCLQVEVQFGGVTNGPSLIHNMDLDQSGATWSSKICSSTRVDGPQSYNFDIYKDMETINTDKIAIVIMSCLIVVCRCNLIKSKRDMAECGEDISG